MKKLAILSIIVITVGVASGQSKRDKIAWLSEHAYEPSLSSKGKDDFSDLTFLKEVIGEKRIVMLGEQYHQDGATLEQKVRIVKYLHQEMGFEVLLMEAPLMAVHRVKQLTNTEEDRVTNFSYFHNEIISIHLLELHQYVYRSGKGVGNPLELEGIDIGYGDPGQDSLLAFITRSIQVLDTSLYKSIEWQELTGCLKMHRYYVPLEEMEKRFSVMKPKLAKHGLQGAYVIKCIENAIVGKNWWQSLSRNAVKRSKRNPLIIKEPNGYHDLRDAQIARNVEWYLDEVYPDKKVIIWAANYHIARNTALLNKTYFGCDSCNRTMGCYLWENSSYRNNIYSVAFIAGGGMTGQTFETGSFAKSMGITLPSGRVKVIRDKKRDRLVTPYLKPKRGSMEQLLSKTRKPYAFVNLRNTGQEGNWLHTSYLMNPCFHKSYKYTWSEVYDGLFFIKEMKPDLKRHIMYAYRKKKK